MRSKTSLKRFLLITTVLMCIYLAWRLLFTLPFEAGTAQVLWGLLLIQAEIVTALTTFELYYRKVRSQESRLECPKLPQDCFPDVDVFIATHNEDPKLLYNTANACTYLEYPDKSRVHIYLCDDGNRKAVAKLAEKLGIGYLGLEGNQDAKSGNLNNALSKTSSPLIATFDADMIPQRTFLMKTVPYFFLPQFKKEDGVWRRRLKEEMGDEPLVGLVQTPQSFYNPDLFQFNLFAEHSIPNEQDFFSREINLMRNSSNAPAYTGSNAVISREAIERIGGFPVDTITEDFETSIRLQKEGYLTYAAEEVLAAGLSAATAPGLFKQRIRWARGVIHSLQNTKAITSGRLPFSARMAYLSSFFYWWSFFNRLIFILSPIAFALFDFQLADCGFWELMVFWLPAYLCYSMSMGLLSGNIRNQRWSQVVDTVFAPYLVIPVLLETLGIHEKRFRVTNKKKTDERQAAFWYALPYLLLLTLSVIAMVRYVRGKYGLALFYSLVIIFWLSYNIISLIYALFLVMGRRSLRKFERIGAKEKVFIKAGGLKLSGTTENLSEEGMLFWTREPAYLPEKLPLQVKLRTPYYQAELTGQLVYVKEKEGKWFYALKVRPVDEKSRSQYAQIIYDRPHSLPRELDVWSTAYDELRRILSGRLSKTPAGERRKAFRIPIGKWIKLSEGARGMVYDFNYEYLAMKDFHPGQGGENHIYRFVTPGKRELRLKRTGRKANQPGAELFEVVNKEQLFRDGVTFWELVHEFEQLEGSQAL